MRAEAASAFRSVLEVVTFCCLCQAGYVMSMNTRRLTQITIGAAALAILATITSYGVSSAESTAAAPAEVKVSSELATSNQLDTSLQPILGNPDASVQVVIFSDFLCPPCSTFAEVIFPVITAEYEDNEDVAFFYVDFPIMPGSEGVATVADCVYQQSNEAFWELFPVFMSSQDQIRNRSDALQLAGEYAPSIDRDALVACAEDPATLAAVEADYDMAVQAGALGTPTVLVNESAVSNSWAAINEAISIALP